MNHFNGSTLNFSQRFQLAETETGQEALLFDHDPAGLPIFEQSQQCEPPPFTSEAIS
jgi:hypothetical protein